MYCSKWFFKYLVSGKSPSYSNMVGIENVQKIFMWNESFIMP